MDATNNPARDTQGNIVGSLESINLAVLNAEDLLRRAAIAEARGQREESTDLCRQADRMIRCYVPEPDWQEATEYVWLEYSRTAAMLRH